MKYHENASWSEFPFIRLGIPLISGMLFFDTTQLYRSTHFLPCYAVFTFLLLVSVLIKIDASYRLRWILGSCIFLIIFLLGGLLLMVHDARLKLDYFIPNKTASSYLVASLDEAPRDTKRGKRCLLRVEKEIENGQAKNASGLVMAYFTIDSSSVALNYGDRILFKQERIGIVRTAANPGGFDYQAYLAQKQVYYTCTLSPHNWLLLPGNSGHAIVSLSYRLRDALLSIYKANGIGEEQFGVLAALVLGYTQEIENDLTAAYAAAGVTHVLSVSGMHVGLIYMLLTYALSWLGLGPKARAARALLLLAFLWFYALLTGLSPAVLRAATMLSLIVLGKAWKKQENTINTVAASAFLLLLLNPWLLYDVGFQLSYLAVCGIVFIHPYIYDWFSPERYWVEQIWSLVSVSLAAQLTTCLPALYYFHQFPLLFLITNVLVIPLSTLIIYGGIALIACAPFPWIVQYVGVALNNMVFALNAIVLYVRNLPFALLQGIWIDRVELLLLHAFLICLVLYLINQRARPLLLLLCLGAVLLVYRFYVSYTIGRQRVDVLYAIRGYTAMDIIDGDTHVFLTNGLSKEEHVLMNTSVKPSWGTYHLTPPLEMSLRLYDSKTKQPRLTLLVHGSKTYLFVAGDFRHGALKKIRGARVDCLILCKNAKVPIRDLLIVFKPLRILTDGSSSSYYRKKWKDACKKWGVPFYDIQEEGAFVISH